MSVIATLVEPHGVTRIFFGRIAQAIEQSLVIADLKSERGRYCLSAATSGRTA
jgi:hypothetical protein